MQTCLKGEVFLQSGKRKALKDEKYLLSNKIVFFRSSVFDRSGHGFGFKESKLMAKSKQ